jgi:hypothetical protein
MATEVDTEFALKFKVDRGPSILDIAAFISDIGIHSKTREIWVTIDRERVSLGVSQILVCDAWPREGLTLRGSIRRWPGQAQYDRRHFEYPVKTTGRQGGELTLFTASSCSLNERFVAPEPGSSYPCAKCGRSIPST